MFHSFRRFTRRSPLAFLAVAVTATAAVAATNHRFTTSTATGSLGSQAVVQTTSSGGAIQGEVDSSANTTIKLPFGVLGEYDASSNPKFGIGVAGISTTGYGVGGEALGNQPSVIGYAGGPGPGVEGVTPASSSGAAIYGVANGSGYGGYFYSNSGLGLYVGTPGIGGIAVLGLPGGTGIEANGYSGNAESPVIAGYDQVGHSDLVGLYGLNPASQSPQENFIVQGHTLNASGDALGYGSDVQVSGDLYVYGRVIEQCTEYPAVSGDGCYEPDLGSPITLKAGSGGSTSVRVRAYDERQSLPTIEDFGQTRMTGGSAYVRLDPAFAATTNPGSPYLVFVTPEGNSHGVFTSDHSMNGFAIHENDGGRSSIVVDYRIVAKPLGDRSQRFAAVRESRKGYTGIVRSAGRHVKNRAPDMPRALISNAPAPR